MQFKKFENKYILRLDKGEEIVETLTKFCKENGVKLGFVSGIGATNKAKVGFFNVDTKEYSGKEFTGNLEICSLVGNISTQKGEPYIHLHATISDEEHRCFGGHLNYAYVSATFEVIIGEVDGSVDREFSEEIGLNLYKF